MENHSTWPLQDFYRQQTKNMPKQRQKGSKDVAYQMGKRRGRKERKRGGRGGEQEVRKCGSMQQSGWQQSKREGKEVKGRRGRRWQPGRVLSNPTSLCWAYSGPYRMHTSAVALRSEHHGAGPRTGLKCGQMGEKKGKKGRKRQGEDGAS